MQELQPWAVCPSSATAASSERKTQTGKGHLFLRAEVRPHCQSAGHEGAAPASEVGSPPRRPGQPLPLPWLSAPGHQSNNLPLVQAAGRGATHTWLQQRSQPRQQELKIPASWHSFRGTASPGRFSKHLLSHDQHKGLPWIQPQTLPGRPTHLDLGQAISHITGIASCFCSC